MRLRKKDLKRYGIYNYRQEKNACKETKRVYFKTTRKIEGNLQPWKAGSENKEYGIELQYAFVMFTTDKTELKELDRIGLRKPEYEVKAIQDWGSYRRVVLEKVRP